MKYRVQLTVVVEASDTSEALDAAWEQLAQERKALEMSIHPDYSPVDVPTQGA